MAALTLLLCRLYEVLTDMVAYGNLSVPRVGRVVSQSAENRMPKGPNGQRRPADVIGAAVMVGRLATGQITEPLKQKSGRARSGYAGGKARAGKLSSAKRRSIAKKVAAARWE